MAKIKERIQWGSKVRVIDSGLIMFVAADHIGMKAPYFLHEYHPSQTTALQRTGELKGPFTQEEIELVTE